jgi:hypothetical protein
VLITVTPQDELTGLQRNFPFAPVNARPVLHVVPMLFPNTYQVSGWRESFAREVRSVWSHGGDIWIVRRVQRARPLPQWHWVEGDDERLSWSDVCAFFAHLETDMALGGDDGFRRLSRSAKNQAFLGRLASRAPRPVHLAAVGTIGLPE